MAPLLSKAQFATGGSGRYTDRIFWLNWEWAQPNNEYSGVVAFQNLLTNGIDSFTEALNRRQSLTNIPAGNYTWMINPYVKVVATVSNKTTTGRTQWLSYTPNSYPQSGFQYMYTGLENKKIGIGNEEKGIESSAKMDIVIKMYVLKNSVWTLVNNANNGIVFSDAESLSNVSEKITCLVNNNSTWYLLDAADSSYNRSTNSMDAIPTTSGCTSESSANNYKIVSSEEQVIVVTGSKQDTFNYKKVELNNLSSNEQIGNTAILYLRGVDSLKNLTVTGQGVTYVAVGYYISNSISQSPKHKSALHLLDLLDNQTSNEYVDIPSNSTICLADIRRELHALDNSNSTPVVATDVFFGNPPSARGGFSLNPHPTDPFIIYANDGININTRPVIRTKMPLNFTINATNKQATNAKVLAWADANFNGLFETNEVIADTVIPGRTNNVNFTITTDSINFIHADTLAIRFRITTIDNIQDLPSTRQVQEDPRSYGFATNGEVEDFLYDLVTPLPVTLISFKGANHGTYNELRFTTSKEENIKSYEIQKLDIKSNQWLTIGSITPYNNQEISNYTFVDEEVLLHNQYRLKINDVHNSEYSKIIFISGKENNNTLITVYPNPAKDHLFIKGIKESLTAEVYNTSGQLVLIKKLNIGDNQLEITDLNSGMYIISIGAEKIKFFKN